MCMPYFTQGMAHEFESYAPLSNFSNMCWKMNNDYPPSWPIHYLPCFIISPDSLSLLIHYLSHRGLWWMDELSPPVSCLGYSTVTTRSWEPRGCNRCYYGIERPDKRKPGTYRALYPTNTRLMSGRKVLK